MKTNTMKVPPISCDRPGTFSRDKKSHLPSRRVLVVDDNRELARIIGKFLEDRSHQVAVCDEPKEVFSAFKRIQPEIVVSDMVMPDVDGMEIVIWLAKSGFEGKVILMSGYNSDYLKAAINYAKTTGKFTIVSLMKPVAFERIFNEIEA